MSDQKRKHLVIGLLILVSLGACKNKSEKATLLRLKYEKGNTFDIKYQTYAKTDDKRVPHNQVVRMVFRVDSIIGDSLYVLSSKLDYARFRNEGNISSDEFASDKPEAEMSLREKQRRNIFKSVVEELYTLTINNKGKIVKPFSSEGGRPIAQQYIPIEYENCQIVFPEQPVGIGDEWTNELYIPGTKGRQVCTYTIEGIKDDVIRIDLSGKYQPDGKWGKSKDFYGHYLIDKETKRIISARYKIEGKIAWEGDGVVGVTLKSRNAVHFKTGIKEAY